MSKERLILKNWLEEKMCKDVYTWKTGVYDGKNGRPSVADRIEAEAEGELSPDTGKECKVI